jgi:hypothetical protein
MANKHIATSALSMAGVWNRAAEQWLVIAHTKCDFAARNNGKNLAVPSRLETPPNGVLVEIVQKLLKTARGRLASGGPSIAIDYPTGFGIISGLLIAPVFLR